MPDYVEIKEKYKIINTIRLKRDLTYKSLAKEIGLNHITLYNVINGKTIPNDRTAFKIEQWLLKQKV